MKAKQHGHTVVAVHNGVTYEIEVEESLLGFNHKVTVTFVNKVWVVHRSKKKLTVTHVYKVIRKEVISMVAKKNQ